MKTKISNNVQLLLKSLVSISLIIFFITKTDIRSVFNEISHINLLTITIFLVLNLTSMGVSAYKWSILLPKYNKLQLFKFNLISSYYSLLLPGQMSGEVVKAYKFSKKTDDGELITASVIIDKVTGLIGLLLIGLIGLILSNVLITSLFFYMMLFCILVCCCMLLMIKNTYIRNKIIYILIMLEKKYYKLKHLINKTVNFINFLNLYTNNIGKIIYSIILGVALQIIYILQNMLLAKDLSIHINIFDWFWIFGVVTVSVLLPFTVAGIGIREGAFIWCIGTLGYNKEKALSLSFSILAMQIIIATIGGIIDFAGNKKQIKKENSI